ncbi:hypothetical protein QTP88_011843 [Uroleucon formosanum]
MIAFTGSTTMKQYMPLKPIKHGFKVWVIAYSVTGYMLGFDIYTGKSAESEVNIGLGLSLSNNVTINKILNETLNDKSNETEVLENVIGSNKLVNDNKAFLAYVPFLARVQ